jgi:hypothetical protein
MKNKIKTAVNVFITILWMLISIGIGTMFGDYMSNGFSFKTCNCEIKRPIPKTPAKPVL